MDVCSAKTIAELLLWRLERDRAAPALWIKQGEWKLLTWEAIGRDVFRTAAWMQQVGVRPGERIAQLSENRYEWLVCDLAMQLLGGIHVPIHAPLTGEQAAYQIRNSGTRLVLLSTAGQAAKLASVAATLPPELTWACFEPTTQAINGATIQSFWKVLPPFDAQAAERLRARAMAEQDDHRLATILYTSGTTGEPKGVMLTQRNLVSNALATLAVFEHSTRDLRLTFLPLSHIFARTCDLYTWIAAGSQLALAESRETVLNDCAALQPTLLNGVPYFYDKVMRVLLDRGQAEEPDALRQLLGGNIRLCCSGGAALPNHVFDFFNSHGVFLAQGYGLTESSPVITFSAPGKVKRGAVGQTIPDVEVKIAADGEILTRGPHVMLGYYQNQAATDQCLRDGWLYTGDLGHLDDEGYLFITGRKKEILITLGGKNIAPVHLESLLTQDPLILQAMVIGDGRKYLTALIVPNPEALRAEIMAHRIPVFSPEQALRHPEVLALYQRSIRERLKVVSHYEQVCKFTLLDRGFTIESGELTPKLSLRRDRILANCRHLVEAMYAEPEGDGRTTES